VLGPAMGRPDRPAPSRACEHFVFEVSPSRRTILYISRLILASLGPPMGRADRASPSRACEHFVFEVLHPARTITLSPVNIVELLFLGTLNKVFIRFKQGNSEMRFREFFISALYCFSLCQSDKQCIVVP